MARLDICRNERGSLVVDVQADTLEELNTRLVIPLMPPETAPRPGHRLNPRFQIGGQSYILVTQYMAATRSANLAPTGHSLRDRSDDISAALDMLLYGF